MAATGVRNAFLPPTALRLMRQAGVRGGAGAAQRGLGRRGAGGGPARLGAGVFGLTVNEFYGQTECNAVIGNAAAVLAVRPGVAGRAVPGHAVAILGARRASRARRARSARSRCGAPTR